MVDAARYTEGRSGRIELVGEQGQLVGDHVHGYGLLIQGRQPVPLEVPAAVNTVEEALKAFVRMLVHDEEPPINAVDGYQVLEIAEACYHSASSGGAIELESDEDDDDELDDDLDVSMWNP